MTWRKGSSLALALSPSQPAVGVVEVPTSLSASSAARASAGSTSDVQSPASFFVVL